MTRSVASLALVVEDGSFVASCWFPPTKSVIKVDFGSSLDKEARLGNFYNIISTQPLKNLVYNKDALIFGSPVAKELSAPRRAPNLFATRFRKGGSELTVCDVPLFVGNHSPSEKCFIGYNTFFGRVSIGQFAENVQLIKQFSSYSCNIQLMPDDACVLGCKWTVSAILLPVRVLPALVGVTATILKHENGHFVLRTESDSIVLVNDFDIQESIAEDVNKKQQPVPYRLKVICEGENDTRLPALSCFATAVLSCDFRRAGINLQMLDGEPLPTPNDVVQQIMEKLSMEEISERYGEDLAAQCKEWLKRQKIPLVKKKK